MLIKSKVVRVEQSMTPFWKEERLGYNIYHNEQKQFFWLRPPPYTLKVLDILPLYFLGTSTYILETIKKKIIMIF